MSEEEFIQYYGMTPKRAREILEEVRHLINAEVHETIDHADYYIHPEAYGYGIEDGVDLEKDDDADGYSCLYDYGERNSAVKTFMRIISFHTTHGGHTSAIRACELMELEWEADR